MLGIVPATRLHTGISRTDFSADRALVEQRREANEISFHGLCVDLIDEVAD